MASLEGETPPISSCDLFDLGCPHRVAVLRGSSAKLLFSNKAIASKLAMSFDVRVFPGDALRMLRKQTRFKMVEGLIARVLPNLLETFSAPEQKLA